MHNYYFVRPNGGTSHNDPSQPQCYVPGEPPTKPGGKVNYFEFCLKHGIARIGWPDTGDLRHADKRGALSQCYDIQTIKPLHRGYLEQFQKIAVGSVILLPDRDHPGILCLGDVTEGYYYFHEVPDEPYECAHRVKVRWDRNSDGVVKYQAKKLGIDAPRGFWRRAFHQINLTQKPELIERIDAARGTK